MVLKVTEDTTIQELQKEFQKRFPFLKIEFYKGSYQPGEGSPKGEQYDPSLKLGELSGNKKKGIITINGLMKVSELEQEFFNVFGITAQVFRKSGNIWLQTITTDHWTLAEQNSHARESSMPATEKNEEELPDYREQE